MEVRSFSIIVVFILVFVTIVDIAVLLLNMTAFTLAFIKTINIRVISRHCPALGRSTLTNHRLFFWYTVDSLLLCPSKVSIQLLGAMSQLISQTNLPLSKITFPVKNRTLSKDKKSAIERTLFLILD